jgi:tetratricopeptide (TPR) repeat protein
LEWRAGDAQCAEAYLERALASGPDRLAVYFQLAIEMERAEVSPEVRRRFERALAEEWKRPPTAAAAMAMVELTTAVDATAVYYESRTDHETALSAYLEKAAKVVAFSEEQLLRICAYLEQIEAWSALETSAWRGAELFPKNYHFALFLGRSVAGRGARRLPRAVRRVLQEAGELATQARDLEAATELALLVSGAPRGMGLPDVLRLLGESDVPEELLEELLDQGPPPEFPAPRRRRRKRQRDSAQMPLFDEL